MRNPTFATITLSLLLVCAEAPGQQARSASEVTSTGRNLVQALNGVLAGRGSGEPRERTLILLIDPTTSVVQAGFSDALRQALTSNAERLARTRIGVAGIGSARDVTFAAAVEQADVIRAVDARLERPIDAIKNVYEDVRTLTSALGTSSGAREIVLVTLDNGDAEDDIERTVSVLEKQSVTFCSITKEAYLSDSYWAARPYEIPPRKCRLTGEDGAFVELPWGWLFQKTAANEVAPSATAIYPLSRLAAATGGRVYLHSPAAGEHECAIYDRCLFCDGDHAPTGERYLRARLLNYGASTASRPEVYAEAAADPAFRAMLEAWRRASRSGLLSSIPSVKLTGKSLAPQRPRPGGVWDAGGSTAFSSKARKAAKLAKECDVIRTMLEKGLADAEESGGVPRYRAMATFTSLMLQLTKVNLIIFQGWCEKIAPDLVSKSAPDLDAPEVDSVDRNRRPGGIGHTNHSLCHGVRPFLQVELPGGARLRQELILLDEMVRAFESRYGNSPFAAALHRSGIAQFQLTYPGTGPARSRVRPGSDEGASATPPVRPARPRRSGGGTGGSTTGGR